MRAARAKRKKGRVSLFILFIILTGITIFIIWQVLTLPYFHIKEVKIEGLHRLSYQQLFREELIPPHTSIFEVDIRKLSQKIENNSVVKKVEIERRLPSALLIKVEERVPYACVKGVENFWQVDEEGVILERASNPETCVLITGIDPFKQKKLLLKALKALKLSRSLNLGVKKIVVRGGDEGIILILKKDIKVLLGISPYYEYLSYLPYIFQDAQERGENFNLVDLRFNHQIIVR